MTVFDDMYGAIWQMSIVDVQDKALMNCLIILKDYLEMMLEAED